MNRIFFNPHATGHHPGAAIFSADGARALRALFSAAPGFMPTPLVRLSAIAAELGIGEAWAKDERNRLGQGSFKSLGGAYAVVSLAAEMLSVSVADISRPARPKHRASPSPPPRRAITAARSRSAPAWRVPAP